MLLTFDPTMVNRRVRDEEMPRETIEGYCAFRVEKGGHRRIAVISQCSLCHRLH